MKIQVKDITNIEVCTMPIFRYMPNLLCSLIIILKGMHAAPHLQPHPTFLNILTCSRTMQQALYFGNLNWSSSQNMSLSQVVKQGYFDYHTHPMLSKYNNHTTSYKYNLGDVFHNNYICTCSRQCNNHKQNYLRHFTYLNLMNPVQ